MNKIKVGCLILILVLFSAGCAEMQSEGEVKATYSSEHSEKVEELYNLENVSYYVKLIEETIAYEKFLGRSIAHGLKGCKHTDFYLDERMGEIFFSPEDEENYFRFLTLNHYDQRIIDEIQIADETSLTWFGSAEVDYDVEASNSLPILSDEDKRILNEVCDYIYNDLSDALEKFSFDLYLGDYLKGYDDGREYIMVSLAIVGDRKYFRWIELTEEQDSYDIWLYPPLFSSPEKTELAVEFDSDEDTINNIVSLGYLLGHLEK